MVLPSSDRTASLDSLAIFRELDFDVLVPWASMQGESPVVVVDRAETRSRIHEVILRVRAGSPS